MTHDYLPILEAIYICHVEACARDLGLELTNRGLLRILIRKPKREGDARALRLVRVRVRISADIHGPVITQSHLLSTSMNNATPKTFSTHFPP